MKRSWQRIEVRSKLRLLAAVVAISSLVGCRAPAPPADPFLYRSTIPPPGTIMPGAPPAGQPYYSPPPTVLPGATTVPPTISPGTPIAPSAVPITPAPAPAPSNNRYAPPGGFNIQSSTRAPGAGATPVSFAAPTAPSPSADSGVVAAGWQAPNPGKLNDTGLTPMATTPTTPRADASVVRIVEPAKSAEQPPAASPVPAIEPAKTTTSPASATFATPSPGPTAANVAPADSTSAFASMPATISSSTVTTSVATQTVDRPTVPEITDLPAVATNRDRVKPASSASSTGPVTIPAERPGASYGYDPDYRTLRGKLEYSVATRRWRLSYLPAEGPIDEFGGSVVLPDAGQLQGFEAGDFVIATGTFSAPTAANGPAMFAIQRLKRQ